MPEFLNVEDVLDHVGIGGNMNAAEFGCGSADFTLALAKRLHKVYALDIQEEKLSALKGKAKLEHLNNIAPVLCDLEAKRGSTLQDNSIDLVLIPNVLFQAQNKYAMLEEGKRVLKPGGQLLVIDWAKHMPFSPKQGMMSPTEVKKSAQILDLKLDKEFAAGDYHYALLFKK